MKRTLVPTLLGAALLVACAHDARGHNPETPTDHRAQNASAEAEVAPQPDPVDQKRHTTATDTTREHAPDNTGVNERDRDGQNLTAGDQGNSEIDIDTTQRIRKAVIADDSLSFTAKNVKIITRDGHVTLRGPVNTEAERLSIASAATKAAGAGHVTNQLEVKP